MPLNLKNQQEITATIDDFRTLARKTKGELLPPSYGFEGQNVRFTDEYGSITKRPSRSSYANMATLGTSKVIFIDRFYKNSNATKYFIVAYSTFLKLGDDSGGTFSNIKIGITTGLRWKSVTFKNHWYGVNGTDNNQVYDGTGIENMGVPIPIAPTLALTTGALTGAYYYKLTYEIDGYQEGSSSVASTVVNPSGQGVTVTIPVSSNTRVTARNIYRTLAGGSIYYFVARVGNNTDVTYTDNIADGSLDTTIPAPYDNDGPAVSKYICLHKSRLFLYRQSGNLSRVIYSDIVNGMSLPDVFPADNFFDVIKDNGEDGTAILEDNFGQLICFKPSGIVKINTDTDDPVGWSGFTNILSMNGCIAPYTAVKTSIGIIYLTRYSQRKRCLMVWNGSTNEAVFSELEPILSSIFESRVPDMVGHYHNNAYYLSYTDPTSGNPYNDMVLIIDLTTGAWVIDKKNIGSFSSWTSGTMGTTGTDEGELYTGTSDATGFIYREDTRLQDLLIRFKSQIDLGTLDSALTSSGTEQSPILGLNSEVMTQVGAQIVSTVSDIVSTLTGEQQYVFPSGVYTSPVLEVNAKTLKSVYYNVVLGSYGLIQIYIRTGDTIALCQAASWSVPYSTSGADISALTAKRFIQYKIKLFIDGSQASQYSTVYMFRDNTPNDYVVRISFNLGTLSETSIEMIYTSQWLDFGWVNPLFKRMRKQIFRVRVDFERTVLTGNLYFGYYLDGSKILTQKAYDFATYANKGYFIYPFPIGTYCKTLKYRLYHNDDTEDLKIKAVHFEISPEPINEF